MTDPATVEVSYLELKAPPAPVPARAGVERFAVETLGLEAYLGLYRRVGGPVGWDRRLKMPRAELATLLGSGRLRIYLVRDGEGEPLGFCEFDRGQFPQIELTHFGLLPQAQGRGLGRWLLGSALQAEWQAGPTRIWLHTDTWDHPAAIGVYQRAGFRTYAVRREPVADL